MGCLSTNWNIGMREVSSSRQSWHASCGFVRNCQPPAQTSFSSHFMMGLQAQSLILQCLPVSVTKTKWVCWDSKTRLTALNLPLVLTLAAVASHDNVKCATKPSIPDKSSKECCYMAWIIQTDNVISFSNEFIIVHFDATGYAGILAWLPFLVVHYKLVIAVGWQDICDMFIYWKKGLNLCRYVCFMVRCKCLSVYEV